MVFVLMFVEDFPVMLVSLSGFFFTHWWEGWPVLTLHVGGSSDGQCLLSCWWEWPVFTVHVGRSRDGQCLLRMSVGVVTAASVCLLCILVGVAGVCVACWWEGRRPVFTPHVGGSEW